MRICQRLLRAECLPVYTRMGDVETAIAEAEGLCWGNVQ
jgi:hypothetical protein